MQENYRLCRDAADVECAGVGALCVVCRKIEEGGVVLDNSEEKTGQALAHLMANNLDLGDARDGECLGDGGLDIGGH